MKFLDAEIYKSTVDMSREDWLKERKKSIGGSESAVVLGLNPWKSTLDIYMDKLSNDVNQETSYRMELGNKLEDFVAKEFAEKTGKKVRNVNAILVNSNFPYMSANIDRAIVGERAILECKVTNSFALKDWQDEKIPPFYEIQVQHYMGITGAEKAYFAVLVGNTEFAIKEVQRDDELISMIAKADKDFWENHILKKVLPEPDGSDSYNDAIKERYSQSNDTTIHLKTDNIDKLQNIIDIKENIKKLETMQKKLEQEVKQELEESERGICDGFEVTWKSITANRLDTKRLKKEKPDIYNSYLSLTNSRRFAIRQIDAI